METIIHKNQKGVGLLEVLIALVVASLGLLAVASFHTELMQTSGENKTKSEAQSLAVDKIEELKNNILKEGGFDTALADGTEGSEDITGNNAAFTRTWTITDGADGGPDNHKVITVAVTWEGADAPITINSESIWLDPVLGIVYSSGQAGQNSDSLAPSPNSNSSTTGGESLSGDGQQIDDARDAGDIVNQQFVKAYDSAGRIVVYRSGETAAVLTCHGDAVNTFTGTVYSINALTELDVDISHLGVCYFDNSNDTDVSGYHSSPYACVSCGSCEDGGDGCPADPTIDNGIGPGGWRGKIGLTGVGDSGGSQEQVCFNEQTLDANSNAATAREYKATRINGTVTTNEGINTSYECHDFLVVNRSGPNRSCSDAATDLAGDASFASKSFIRALSGVEDNTWRGNSINSDSCVGADVDAEPTTFTGIINYNSTSVQLNKLTLSISSDGACNSLDGIDAAGSYEISCTATTSAETVTITMTTSQNRATVTAGDGGLAIDSQSASFTVVNTTNGSAFEFDLDR